MILFRDRSQAGKLLGAKLCQYRDRTDVVVAAVATGGVPVGLEVARALRAPLDVVLVQKVVPRGPNHAVLGVIAPGVRMVDESLTRTLCLNHRQVDEAITVANNELQRREHLYREALPAIALRDRFVILVDEGIASGLTMMAAIAAVRRYRPARLLAAVPVAPCSTYNQFRSQVDEFRCLISLSPFPSIAACYYHHVVLKDEVAVRLLQLAECERCGPRPQAA